MLVSVCVITYNHQKYLSQTLDSILKQNRSFEIEIVIGEDCSTDNTRKIAEEFYTNYPNVIKLLPTEKNQGALSNFIRTVQACKGEYIAICEGDDYWTDLLKLQKQVDFLLANPKYGMISSDISLVDENGEIAADNQMIIKQRLMRKEDITFFDLLETNLINTLTVCVKAELLRQLANRVVNEKLWYVFDYWFWLNISLTHKVRVSYEVTAAYRIHGGGISRVSDFIKQRKPFVLYDTINTYRKHNLVLKNNEAFILSDSLYYILRNSNIQLAKRIKIVKVVLFNPLFLYYITKLAFSQAKKVLFSRPFKT